MRRMLLVVLLFLPVVYASGGYSPSSVSITAVVDQDGLANVREEYYFIFPDRNALDRFVEVADGLKNLFPLWSAEIPEIRIHVGREDDVRDLSIYWGKVSDTAVRLVLSYTVPLSVKKRETVTETEYFASRFNFESAGTGITIPQGYTLTVVLPSSAKILEYEPVVENGIVGSAITWVGPITTNRLYIHYSVPKPTGAPSIAELIFGGSASIYVSAGLLVVTAILFLFWGRIKSAVKKYVEENSHFEE